MKTTLLVLGASLLMAVPSWAADGSKEESCCTCVETHGSATCCAHCGKHCDCGKYCQVVPYEKEVKKTVWVVKCEDYCPSLPGCPLGGCGDPDGCGDGCTACKEAACCETCGKGCKDGGCGCDVCAVELAKKQTPPKCGEVHTRKILEKKEVVCKVPSYKCIVVYNCPNCTNCTQGAAGSAEPKPANAPAPAPAPAQKPQELPPAPKTTAVPTQPETASRSMAGF